MRQVTILAKSVPAYRRAFFEGLAEDLSTDGIRLLVVFGQPVGAEASKNDSVSLSGGAFRKNYAVSIRGRQLVYQAVEPRLLRPDLLIAEQASKLLLNYPLLLGQFVGGAPVALWGHGANLQLDTASRFGEALKRRYSALPHWWFAYTDGTRDRVAELGYPLDRITVVRNSIDTEELGLRLRDIDRAQLTAVRGRLGLTPGRTAIYIGGLYDEKRLPFLLDAADQMAHRLPGFRLLVAGDGPLRDTVLRASRSGGHIIYLGRVEGSARAEALASSDVMLMPGLVGLAILDSFTARVPMVTTAAPFHSPEIEYLDPGRNGLITSREASAADYASAVVELLDDPHRLEVLRRGCAASASEFGISEMIRRFGSGIRAALDTPTRTVQRLSKTSGR